MRWQNRLGFAMPTLLRTARRLFSQALTGLLHPTLLGLPIVYLRPSGDDA